MGEKLLSRPPSKIITSYDLLGKPVKRNLKDFKFRASVYGILKEGGSILVERHPQSNLYTLPGGGVDIGERILDGLYREFEEETGLRVVSKRLLWVNDGMFSHWDEDVQNIFIFYEVRKLGGRLLINGNGKDTAEVKFIPLKDLSEKIMTKAFWKAIEEYKKLI